MNMVEKYFTDRFEIGMARNDNLRLLDCECPFCGKEGKVYIKPEKWGVGFCQKCSKGFRVVEFIMEYEDCDSAEAFRILRGEDVDTWVTEAKPKPIKEKAGPYFPAMIALDKKGRTYLNNRGLSDEIIAKYKFLSCHTNGLYDGKTVWSSNRVIVPIFNREGKPVSWQGRSLDPESKTKYLFSPDFKKSEYLYNAWNIEKNPKYLIVAEGVFDCIGWVKAGFKNCVGTFGKTASKEQIKILKDIAPEVLFLAWDYDCIYNMQVFSEQSGYSFKSVRVVSLPFGMDSDECSKAELLELFKSAKAPNWIDKVLSVI